MWPHWLEDVDGQDYLSIRPLQYTPPTPQHTQVPQLKQKAQSRESTRRPHAHLYRRTHTPNHNQIHFRWQSPVAPSPNPTTRVKANGKRQSPHLVQMLPKMVMRWEEWEGERNIWARTSFSISGTSRATYLYKFMATSDAICLCQLMTGPIQKSWKLPSRAESSENIARILWKAAQQKVLNVYIFYLSVKNLRPVSKKPEKKNENQPNLSTKYNAGNQPCKNLHASQDRKPRCKCGCVCGGWVYRYRCGRALRCVCVCLAITLWQDYACPRTASKRKGFGVHTENDITATFCAFVDGQLKRHLQAHLPDSTMLGKLLHDLKVMFPLRVAASLHIHTTMFFFADAPHVR